MLTFTARDITSWISGIEGILRGRFEPVEAGNCHISKKYLKSYGDSGQLVLKTSEKEERKGVHHSVAPLVGQALLVGCNGCSDQSVRYLVGMLGKVVSKGHSACMNGL